MQTLKRLCLAALATAKAENSADSAAAAMELLDHLASRYEVDMHREPIAETWSVMLSTDDASWVGSHALLPRAICEAVLEAVRAET